ncbi:phage tail protein [Pseudomonas fluorescens]|uniref:phage tail protein n=1 Tax=Pseudomonas fluorescens TaxID=294 RepID=UPI000FF5E60D|nr:phage tail protein [Pseudomonas fluorescens]RON90341.1 hypothetical protein BK668_11600 [Pseudomonas fluorescens]
MPWYKTGTVSVTQNSNAVIGLGTAFIANSRVGDAFRGPDGGWYEVTNIASDTALSISPSYQGATNNAGVYALAPMQGYVKDSADALRALVNQFGGVLAVLGTTPTTAGVRSALNLTNTDGVPEGANNKYMTPAGVRAITLAGVDITTPGPVSATDSILAALGKLQASKADLSGTNKTVSIAQGGTGSTTVAAARTALGLGSAAIVDVVGLMSNNAIIETGTTAAGRYIRFADGTLICTNRYTGDLPVTIVYGSVFYGDFPTLVYPFAFVGTVPAVVMQCSIAGGGAWMGKQINSTLTATGSSIIVSPVSRATASVTMEYIAVGRWKL